MRLSLTDRNEFLKAALKTTDKGLADWMVSIVDALDALPEGKADVPCPAYQVRGTGGAGNGQQLLSTHPYA